VLDLFRNIVDKTLVPWKPGVPADAPRETSSSIRNAREQAIESFKQRKDALGETKGEVKLVCSNGKCDAY
jgi:hypothetical protein